MSKVCCKRDNGRSVEMCETMIEACNLSLFEPVNYSTVTKDTDERIYRVGIRGRKYKGKYAVLSYCPFCGAFIDTSDYGFNDEAQEQDHESE